MKKEQSLRTLARGRGRPPKNPGSSLATTTALTPITVAASAPLCAEEKQTLEDLEARIRAGQLSFMVVGTAIAEIRDQKLYRDEYATIEEYLDRRWKMGKAHGFRLMSAAAVMNHLSPIGDKLPENEAQVRALVRLPTDEQRNHVWKKVVEEAGVAGITAKLVEKVASREYPEPDPDADRLEAAKELPDLKDFCIEDLKAARSGLEPKSIKLLIVNTELTDLSEAMNTLGRFLHDNCGVVVICDFQSEPEVRKAIADGKCKLIDRSNWYGQIDKPKTTGLIARHRSLLLAARGDFSFSRDGKPRLQDPLVRAPDSGYPDAPPVELFRTLIEAFTVEGELVVIPADLYAAGVIAARKTRRNVLGVEREEEAYLVGRERLDKVFEAPARLDKLIEASLVTSVVAAEPVAAGGVH